MVADAPLSGPRPPAIRRRPPAPADRLEVVKVHGEGKPAGPGVRFDTLEWMREKARKGSPYRALKPGQVVPGRMTPETQGPPKLTTGRYSKFASKAQWRKFFADPKLRKYAKGKAHATPGPPKVRYRVLPERKGPTTLESAR